MTSIYNYFFDPAAAAEKKEKLETAKKERQQQAVLELRAKLTTEEGAKAARQLVQGALAVQPLPPVAHGTGDTDCFSVGRGSQLALNHADGSAAAVRHAC